MGLEGTYSCHSISCTPFNIPLIRLIAVDCVLFEEACESTRLTELINKMYLDTKQHTCSSLGAPWLWSLKDRKEWYQWDIWFMKIIEIINCSMTSSLWFLWKIGLPPFLLCTRFWLKNWFYFISQFFLLVCQSLWSLLSTLSFIWALSLSHTHRGFTFLCNYE